MGWWILTKSFVVIISQYIVNHIIILYILNLRYDPGIFNKSEEKILLLRHILVWQTGHGQNCQQGESVWCCENIVSSVREQRKVVFGICFSRQGDILKWHSVPMAFFIDRDIWSRNWKGLSLKATWEIVWKPQTAFWSFLTEWQSWWTLNKHETVLGFSLSLVPSNLQSETTFSKTVIILWNCGLLEGSC